jgi:hypothetical protein
MAGRKNQVILSNYDLTYLDLGFGGRRDTGYGTLISWRDMLLVVRLVCGRRSVIRSVRTRKFG